MFLRLIWNCAQLPGIILLPKTLRRLEKYYLLTRLKDSCTSHENRYAVSNSVRMYTDRQDVFNTRSDISNRDSGSAGDGHDRWSVGRGEQHIRGKRSMTEVHRKIAEEEAERYEAAQRKIWIGW